MERPEAEAACVHCQDLGFISFLVPLGHPKFGKAAPCPHCVLGQGHLNRRADQLLKRDGVPDAYQVLSFESFVALPEGQKQGKLLALHALWTLAQNPEKELSLRDVVAQETDLNPEAFPAYDIPRKFTVSAMRGASVVCEGQWLELAGAPSAFVPAGSRVFEGEMPSSA